jgi:predicted permease
VNPTLEVLRPLAYILLLVLLGVGLRVASDRVRKLKPLREVFALLNIFAIWIILPSVVFVSVGKYEGREILEFVNVLAFAFAALGVCFVSAAGISFAAHATRKTTIAMVLNSAFMNVVYIGFPAVYILLGPDALGPAALYAMGIGIPHIIFGTMLASLAAKRKITARSVAMGVLTFPAAFALIAALLFVGFQVPLSPAIHERFDFYVAPVFFALMLVIVGYQIPLVSPKRYLRGLAVVGAFRFLVSPAITYTMMLALGLTLEAISPRPSLLLSAMPPAFFNVILAHNFKLDTKLYGALVFYLTWVSLLVALPVLSFFIS